MSADRTQQSLQAILNLEVAWTARLLSCLAEERSALAKRDIAALQHTTGEKLACTEELEQLERQRERLVADLGFDTDADGVRRCFKSRPDADALMRLWQQVLTNVEACRNGNLANGGVLEAGRRHVEQALAILRGQSASPSLYKPNGDSATNLGQRQLAKV